MTRGSGAERQSAGFPGRMAAAGVIVFLLAAVPIVLTPFPPTTDLPQHLNQVILATAHAGDGAGPYAVLWGAPNTLVYGFIFLLERVFSPEFLGRAVLLFLTAAWIFAIFFTAVRRKRPAEGAVLAALFLFNISFYWGFLNFLAGFPVFIAWFFLTARKEAHPPAWWYAAVMVASFFLYFGHVLWFIAGAAWFGLTSLLRRLPLRSLVLRAATLIPAGLFSLFWYRKFAVFQAASDLNLAPEWINRPFEKPFTLWFRSVAFGGGTGRLETFLFFFLLAWAGLSLATRRQEWRRRVDADLASAAGLFFAIAFFAPDTFRNTIYFSGRWAAVSFILAVLSLPAPRIKPALRRTAAWGAVLVFYLVTTLHWAGYETTELTGLEESLAGIPRASRVLGLDYVKTSRYFAHRPFLQLYSYAHVSRGAELGFSFARHSTGLVAFRRKQPNPWTPKLDWYAERVKESDLAYFDYVLVNGRPYDHDHRLPRRRLSAVTTTGRWRLYRIEK